MEAPGMNFELSQLIGLYLPVSIGVVAQIAFLLLPVDLKNWRDDTLNAMTYVALQLFVAAVVFVAIPRVFDIFHLDAKGAFLLLCVVLVSSWIRVIRIIPLEGTSPIRLEATSPPVVLFTDFYDKDRLLRLAALSESLPDDIRRIQRIKERIRKRGRDSVRGNALAIRS
jgi:hypothetical protein